MTVLFLSQVAKRGGVNGLNYLTTIIVFLRFLNIIVKLSSSKTLAMERNLERTMDNVTNVEGVIGCILADRQGLCLGAKGSASSESAGLIAAIADEAAKLEPDSKAPVIALESDNSV
ncbi:ragulator complex protein LAMTOR5 homolog isoform X2 [Athalia rosae]|uniref:ragulator complex protein LAMTOR5 homolog isoform X2 n=1 Tax=Athalia rosae TaxID=37344 RepID=UPI0020339EE2|nr:ragulator complex protein LAMTOR5 homolog isoform X2 [Athalia rosae]